MGPTSSSVAFAVLALGSRKLHFILIGDSTMRQQKDVLESWLGPQIASGLAKVTFHEFYGGTPDGELLGLALGSPVGIELGLELGIELGFHSLVHSLAPSEGENCRCTRF